MGVTNVYMKTKDGKTAGVNAKYLDEYLAKGYTIDTDRNQKVYGTSNPASSNSSSRSSSSKSSSSGSSSKSSPITPTKTIDDYKKDYEAARSSGNAAGMKAANDAANAIRASQGQAAQVANKDIEYIASQNKNTNLPASAQAISYALNPADVSKYSDNYMSEINRRTTLQNTLTSEKDKADNLAAIQALVNARTAKINTDSGLSDYKYQPIGEAWDLGRGIMQGVTTGNWAYNDDVKPATKTPPAQTEQLYNQDPFQQYGLRKVVETDNAFMITDAKGRKMTISKKAIERNGLQTYIDENGNFIDRSSDREKTSTSNANYAAESINSLDQYRNIAKQILKPQFDKAVDEQMKQFTNRMISQGFQGQLPGEEMRAKIMSDMQADYESQVSALAQQLMRQDIEDARWEAEFGLKQEGFDFEKALKQQELDWKKEDRGYDKESQAIDLDYKKWQLEDSKKKSAESSEDRLRRIIQEKEDRDWTTFQREKEKELYDIELANKRLDYNLRLETDPYKKMLLEQDYQMNKLNMEKIKADIDYIKTQKGKSSSESTKEAKIELVRKWQSWAFSGKTATEGLKAIRQVKSQVIEDIGLEEYNKIEKALIEQDEREKGINSSSNSSSGGVYNPYQ